MKENLKITCFNYFVKNVLFYDCSSVFSALHFPRRLCISAPLTGTDKIANHGFPGALALSCQDELWTSVF